MGTGAEALGRCSRRLGVVVSLALIVGAGPATAADQAKAASQTQTLATVVADLDKGDSAGAERTAALMLERDPRNARLQFLNGLAYHLASERGDAAAADLAQVGYQVSLKYDPNDFWANTLLATLQFERGEWAQAQAHFSQAVLLQPDDWRAMAGLAASSYYAGDEGLASLAGARAAKLAPAEPEALRIAAITAAAARDGDGAKRYLAAYAAAGGSPDLGPRLAQLQRMAGAAGLMDAPTPGPGGQAAPPPGVDSPWGDKQLSVEVTLILSDDTVDRLEGINLLDGLQLQFGYNTAQTTTTGLNTAAAAANSFARVVTQTIALPQINYSLNLFNRTTDSYWVLSRPTLAAYLGEESAFFVGHTISVPVAGVNLGSLQTIEAGLTIKMTPIEMSRDRVKFKVSADRSFFDPLTQVPGFAQQIGVFKESASATAELEYGQTLILSGLSEHVTDAEHSVTPGMSKLPLVGELFGHHDVSNEKTSVLILVTPLPPVEMNLPRRLTREGAVAEVTRLWTRMVDPYSDTAAVTAALAAYADESKVGYSVVRLGDVSLNGPSDKRILGEALASVGGETTNP
jgi:Flp pilus assembly protein TadD